ncbi:MAG: hypothetical protein KH100_15930 [Dysgonomonas mossii]|uniref:hypothetical protein n=1 Tax=Dysgonomonas mossii TaxID=163665 RepID=UPI001DDF64F3|nr:hypothetical protein [Dysgonomonas mossii]MBS7112672.1 hypothetical protein [Dysgonomonas mossii]
MKTIQVTDQIYDFLMNLSKEIKNQDNRATAAPYFYQVQEDREIAVPEGCGVEVWVMDGQVCLRTEDDIREAVFEWKEWDLKNKNHQKKYEQLTSFDVDEILEENYRKVNIDISHTYTNCFLTYKAYEEHLRQNRHNLTNPKSFLFHAFRNPEMDMLFRFLQDLTTEGKEATNE